LNHANAFLSNPTVSRWVQPVPMTAGSAWPGGNGSGMSITEAIRPMRAAWCYMTLPGHTNANAWRDETKALLLFTARHANHDFSDNSKYSVSFPGSMTSPIFAVAGWMVRLIKSYDMLGRDVFTSSELAELDRWFHGWANYILHQIEGEANNGKLPNLTSGNITTSNMSGTRSQVAYNGGPNIANSNVFNNRVSASIGSGALIANYLKYHGVTPGTGGTQPSYGWWTVDYMLDYVGYYAKAWVVHSLHPNGWCFDYHRAQEGNGSPTTGWTYAANELSWMIDIAEWASRRGDTSLWNYATTQGAINTAGVPTAGGFTHKSFRYGAWMSARYVNNGWGRVITANNGSTGPLAPSNAVREMFTSAKVHKQYPSDTLLASSWTRIGSNMPGYPSSPNNQGSFNGLDGEMGIYIGLIEVAGL